MRFIHVQVENRKTAKGWKNSDAFLTGSRWQTTGLMRLGVTNDVQILQIF